MGRGDPERAGVSPSHPTLIRDTLSWVPLVIVVRARVGARPTIREQSGSEPSQLRTATDQDPPTERPHCSDGGDRKLWKGAGWENGARFTL
jgi:hypothetical protein